MLADEKLNIFTVREGIGAMLGEKRVKELNEGTRGRGGHGRPNLCREGDDRCL